MEQWYFLARIILNCKKIVLNWWESVSEMCETSHRGAATARPTPTSRLLPFRPLVCLENETPPQSSLPPAPFPHTFRSEYDRLLQLDITSLYSRLEPRCRLWLQIPTGLFFFPFLTNKSESARPRNTFPSPCPHHVRSLERSFG